MKSCSLCAVLWWVLSGGACVLAQSGGAEEAREGYVAPSGGALVLAGGPRPPEAVYEAFLQLTGDGLEHILVVGAGRQPGAAARALARAAGLEPARMPLAHLVAPRSAKDLLPLLRARAIWLEVELPTRRADPYARAALEGLLARGGVVGASSAAAPSVAALGLLPGAVVSTEASGGSDLEAARRAAGAAAGKVGWALGERTALVLHRGRRLCVVGKGSVWAAVPGDAGQDAREAELSACGYDVRGHGLEHAADLLSWVRSARLRQGVPTAAEEVPVPRLAAGSLILHGGRRVSEATFRRFIELAGGPEAPIVCIPSGLGMREGNKPDSYSAGKLEELGCVALIVLYPEGPRMADRDPRILGALKRARGVWFDGGRTYRVMDAFEGTRAEALLRGVLKRGGVLAGSSAGAQIQSDLLMRGNPRTNRSMIWPGYRRGFGFLPGTLVDVHFRQRKREAAFLKLIDQTPRVLGIGVDENTALLVQGAVGEVIGEAAVTIYDRRPVAEGEARSPISLAVGQRFDLVQRRVLD